MSDPHHTSAATTNHLGEVDSPATIWGVYAIIVGLSALTIGLSTTGLGKYALVLQLAIATVQAGLVAYYFMHLRQGDRVVILTALASIFWMGILFVLFMADYMSRHLIIN